SSDLTRDLLARFYKVHPSFFVSDPEGFDPSVTSISLYENRFDSWLISGAEQFAHADPDLAEALRNLANHEASRAMLLLVEEIIRDGDLLARLRSVKKPDDSAVEPSTAPTT